MGKHLISVLFSIGFSVLFALAIVYTSIELIRVINTWMLGLVPDCVLISEFPRCEEIESRLRVVGYVSLGLVLLTIVVGLTLGRTSLTLLSSVLLYLPTVGYFAFTMFFLAGVGVLRVLWYPFIDSELFLRLGMITYVPLWTINSILTWIVGFTALDLSADFTVPIGFAFMIVGLSVFTLSAATWLYDRLSRRRLSTWGIYSLSRHPQYLGFIVWSYGFLSLASVVEGGRGWAPPAPGLPWLITSAAVLSVALLEEINLRRSMGAEYLSYVRKTPFILPMPNTFLRIARYPAKIITGKEAPETRKEVLMTSCLYFALTLLLSLLISYLLPLK
ncbi:MAG: DUF1295 domain-containing protein [Zestosphaera sp.]